MGKTASRIEWVDIAKGMSIILIVLGHSFLSSIPLEGDWCAAFMIPFFFFVSGLLFKPGKDLKTFAKKKWLGLLRPFIFFSAIVLIGYFCISVDVGKNRLNTLHY